MQKHFKKNIEQTEGKFVEILKEFFENFKRISRNF